MAKIDAAYQAFCLARAKAEWLKGDSILYQAVENSISPEMASRWRPQRKRDDLFDHIRRCRGEIMMAIMAEAGVACNQRYSPAKEPESETREESAESAESAEENFNHR